MPPDLQRLELEMLYLVTIELETIELETIELVTFELVTFELATFDLATFELERHLLANQELETLSTHDDVERDLEPKGLAKNNLRNGQNVDREILAQRDIVANHP